MKNKILKIVELGLIAKLLCILPGDCSREKKEFHNQAITPEYIPLTEKMPYDAINLKTYYFLKYYE